MNLLDYLVLLGSVLGIALYGIIRTRGRRNLHDYLRGKKQPWFLIGLSVMATQASAVTFLSTPGQGYESGMAFVQNYFAIPIAMIIIAAFFLPIYRKLNVYTAYEYLGKRFDTKTRLFAAAIFLLARGMGAGITIYAPAIVLSTVFGWSLPLTIIGSGLVVTLYTVAGGSDAVTHTQKYQVAIIFAGMVAAFVILLQKIPCSFTDALTLAGHFNKTTAVDFSLDPKKRYTIWTGLFGGIFLMLSYFGTDQSQVQRYISGDQLRESRLGLMFNALLKIPMQFFILLLGVILFVFYQLHAAPIYFNQTTLHRHEQSSVAIIPPVWMARPLGQASGPVSEDKLLSLQAEFYHNIESQKQNAIKAWLDARRIGDKNSEAVSLANVQDCIVADQLNREAVKAILKKADPTLNTNDSDYVFITFILDNLPHGLIGLLVAAFFAAALSSKASELNALASTSTIDFYRPFIRPPPPDAATSEEPPPTSSIENKKSKIENPSDRHYVLASKAFTAFWGLVAIAFALFAHMSENLIQASNIIGSVFSGVVLGLFLIAFFLKHIRGTAAFTAALIAQTLVLVIWALTFFNVIDIAYLWFNAIGSLACIALALIIQQFLPQPDAAGFPVITQDPTKP